MRKLERYLVRRPQLKLHFYFELLLRKLSQQQYQFEK
jgi:hypothetical protein